MPIPIGGGPIVATYTIQADLSGTAYGGTPTWTDITAYVLTTGDGQPVQITAGRQDESSDVSPSQCSFTLINDDGRFTPGNASSPYYPHVLPGVRIRVSESVGGTVFYRFDGYVDSWETTIAPGTRSALCAVAATDILARMGLDQPLRAIYDEEVLTDEPVAYYQMAEADGAASAGDSSEVGQSAIAIRQTKYGGGDYAFGNDGIVVTAGTSLQLNANLTTGGGDDLKGYYLTGPAVAGVTPTADYTFEAWVSTRNRTVGQTGSIAVLANGRRSFGVGWNFGYAGITYRQAGGPGVDNYYGPGDITADVAGSGWHHIALTYVAGTHTYTFYLDGAVSNIDVDATAPAWTPNVLYIGYDPVNGNCFRGWIQDVAIYNAALSAARIQAHHTAGVNAFAGERTDTHISRLQTYRTTTGASLDTGEGTVGLHDTNGITLQQAFLDTGKAEGGLVYIDGQGQLVLRKRTVQYDAATGLTLDADANAVSVGTTFRVDTQGVVNDVTISRPSGADQRVVDVPSQTAYGVRATSDTLVLNSDRDAKDAAGWRVAESKTPETRSPNIVVDLATETSVTTAQAVLTAAPWTRVTLDNLPSNAPASTMDVLIQGWSESIGVDEWTVTFYTTPAPPSVLRADATADAYTALDSGLVIGW